MSSRRPPTRPAALDDKAIDALYGLEPVFEPAPAAAEASGPTQFTQVSCPYCGESFETLLDLSAGSSSYVEDCQVCCQSIDLSFRVSADGRLLNVSAQRTD